jgi:hypothetical protein
MSDQKQPDGEGRVQGEGDYVAGRRFQEAERSFVERGPIERKAREAAEALDGPEGKALERARVETGEGKARHAERAGHAGDASDPELEDKLDHGLDETFPASDPVSVKHVD